MIVDTSAIVAILFDEDDAGDYEAKIQNASVCRMSAANLFEAAMVVEGRNKLTGEQELDLLIRRMGIEIVPVDEEQVHAAREAWRKFGKRQGSPYPGVPPAELNFGDCFAYALAHVRGEALLFKGDDFGRTDVVAALG